MSVDLQASVKELISHYESEMARADAEHQKRCRERIADIVKIQHEIEHMVYYSSAIRQHGR